MEREYPQILNSATTPHDAIFIPEVYLFGSTTEKVKYFMLIVSIYKSKCPQTQFLALCRQMQYCQILIRLIKLIVIGIYG